MSTNRSIYNSEKANAIFACKLRLLFNESKRTHNNLAEYICEKTGEKITRQAVSQWCNGNTCPNLKTIPIIANFFDVSIEFLLTETSVRSTDENVRAASEYTGLSELAVFTLHQLKQNSNKDSSYNSSCFDIISLMISDDKFLETISQYLCFDKEQIKIKIAHDGIIDVTECPVEISINGKTIAIKKGANFFVDIAEESLCEDVYLRIKRLKEIYLKKIKGENS